MKTALLCQMIVLNLNSYDIILGKGIWSVTFAFVKPSYKLHFLPAISLDLTLSFSASVIILIVLIAPYDSVLQGIVTVLGPNMGLPHVCFNGRRAT